MNGMRYLGSLINKIFKKLNQCPKCQTYSMRAFKSIIMMEYHHAK